MESESDMSTTNAEVHENLSKRRLVNASSPDRRAAGVGRGMGRGVGLRREVQTRCSTLSGQPEPSWSSVGGPRLLGLLSLWLWGLTGLQLAECAAQPPVESPPLVAEFPAPMLVGTKHSPPFSFQRQDGTWTGISIELWRSMADDLDIDYEFRECEIPEAMRRLQSGELQAAIAAISITAERDRQIDFSHAFYTTGLGVAVPKRRITTMWRFATQLLTSRFLLIVMGLVVISLVTGVVFWKLERSKNEGLFGGRSREGVSMGIWWSTIMLLGHKGIMPATTTARVVAVSVMLCSTVAVSTLTGVIASTITVARIGTTVQHPDDLRHFRIASVESSTSAKYLEDRRLRYQAFPTIEEALASLSTNDAEAVVYDLAMLRYQQNTQFESQVDVLPVRFNEQQYAIALEPDSLYREQLNHALLRVTSSDNWLTVLFRYLGE